MTPAHQFSVRSRRANGTQIRRPGVASRTSTAGGRCDLLGNRRLPLHVNGGAGLWLGNRVPQSGFGARGGKHCRRHRRPGIGGAVVAAFFPIWALKCCRRRKSSLVAPPAVRKSSTAVANRAVHRDALRGDDGSGGGDPGALHTFAQARQVAARCCDSRRPENVCIHGGR